MLSDPKHLYGLQIKAQYRLGSDYQTSVEPLLAGTVLSCHPVLSGRVKFPNFFSFNYCNCNFIIKRSPLSESQWPVCIANFKNASTRALGSRATCHLTDFSGTLPF